MFEYLRNEDGTNVPVCKEVKATAASYEYYVPNAETGYFDIYKNGEKVKQSNVKFVQETPNSITASLDKQNLILTGVKGISGEKVVISLTGDLTGLVFMPNLYLDGIETLTYEITQLTLDHPVNLSFKSNFNELNKDNQKDKDDK